MGGGEAEQHAVFEGGKMSRQVVKIERGEIIYFGSGKMSPNIPNGYYWVKYTEEYRGPFSSYPKLFQSLRLFYEVLGFQLVGQQVFQERFQTD